MPTFSLQAPTWAQCHDEMTLVRIERRAFGPLTDRFVRIHCGLVDQFEHKQPHRWHNMPDVRSLNLIGLAFAILTAAVVAMAAVSVTSGGDSGTASLYVDVG